ncbi:MAG: bifunctional acetate--CoA ligase family protein/GNAT family N-acetyltransferase [Bernardetiaceae bacterium]|nr:bifunctional acetate--CoA ligase family protein/GNAT family N-acetyltransferase [Bernardetiaceae bacterium]
MEPEKPSSSALKVPYHHTHFDRQTLQAIFNPKSIALIGASERQASIGSKIMRNLITNKAESRQIYPVNLKRKEVMGIDAYRHIKDIPEPVDLAIIATPAHTVPDVLKECAEAGAKGAIIISAGFREVGERGLKLEQELQDIIKGYKIRLIGPNCIGIMKPQHKLNATFLNQDALPGTIGFASQSGALCGAILDWSFKVNVGFSAFISVGSMTDLDWSDIIYYLGDDPHTRVIVLYMESVKNAGAFLSAAREIAYTKPIIIIKSGRTEKSAAAATSHTGTMAGADATFDAAFRRSGVLRVNSIADMFYMAKVLAKQPRPFGKSLAIITNSGGPGIIAADALIEDGGELAELSQSSMEALNQFLPEAWSHSNPIDIQSFAPPENYKKAIEIACEDKNIHAILVVLAPQGFAEPTETAKLIASLKKSKTKPILAAWMGGKDVEEGVQILNDADIPTFSYPDTAVRIFNYMWRYSYNLRGVYETPQPAADLEENPPDRQRAENIIKKAQESGRTILSEYESKEILKAYKLPVAKTYVAYSKEEAITMAKEIGFPVVLKVHSHQVPHKMRYGGVKLNLENASQVREAFIQIKENITSRINEEAFLGVTVQPMNEVRGAELIAGSTVDEQFGPILLFGTGGQLANYYKDHVVALPPLNTTLARRALEQIQIYKTLKSEGLIPASVVKQLEAFMVRFSLLITEQPWIKDMDMNPVLISIESRVIEILDAHIELHPADTAPETMKPLAIRPYPSQYEQEVVLKDGTKALLRPIRAEDEPLAVDFHKKLSAESVYLRYFYAMSLNMRISHERLSRICFADYAKDINIVLEIEVNEGELEIWAAGRVIKLRGTPDAEFGVAIADMHQKKGIGMLLMNALINVCIGENIRYLFADVLPNNTGMKVLCEKLGFSITRDFDEGVLKVALDIQALKAKKQDEQAHA